MTVIDTKLRAKVVVLLARLGKDLLYTTYPSAAYDPTAGETTLGSPVNYTEKSIPPYDVEMKYVDGDLIRIGDMMSGVGAKDLGFTPVEGLLVTVDSVEWKIVQVSPIYSGNQIALYIFRMRK